MARDRDLVLTTTLPTKEVDLTEVSTVKSQNQTLQPKLLLLNSNHLLRLPPQIPLLKLIQLQRLKTSPIHNNQQQL